ncbi:hypothetical protein B0H14DRAFT_3126892 [Mycena olivaceomarginata]|nr:hypothetical protein B0H14DRAFT_3126892 [Mycena olivaceomarginata]
MSMPNLPFTLKLAGALVILLVIGVVDMPDRGRRGFVTLVTGGLGCHGHERPVRLRRGRPWDITIRAWGARSSRGRNEGAGVRGGGEEVGAQEEAEGLVAELKMLDEAHIGRDRQRQIARQIDCVITERIYFAKKRVLTAQNLEERIKKDLVPIFAFLQAARRSGTEQFTFPHAKHSLLQTLASIEESLYTVADMVRGHDDPDGTEPDSELEVSGVKKWELKREA